MAVATINKAARTNVSTNLYGQPFAKGTVLTTLESNMLGQVEAATSKWYKVIAADGVEGFIPGSQVSLFKRANKKNVVTSMGHCFIRSTGINVTCESNNYKRQLYTGTCKL